MIKEIGKSILNWQVLIIVVVLVLSSCGKGDPGDCFKSTGDDITEKRSSAAFNKIILEDNINLVLTQTNIYEIEVHGGENLLKKVKTTVDGDVLTITNNNSCNWVRNFDREITVYANFEHLSNIDYRGSGDISSTNTIVGDSLILNVYEGAGRVDLDVEMNRNYIYFHIGTADIYYSGYSHLSYITASSFGPIYAENMNTVYTYINNEGSNNCHIKVGYRLEATIKNLGDIFYTGNPEVQIFDTGEGQLIKVED